ncbi:S1C family serine protease [Alteromonas sp. H39]|uniref:S1C family serine protease n=1 Tax=Alteromonas sp. H39 TaxID=3389876 RepID=UPI0039E16659
MNQRYQLISALLFWLTCVPVTAAEFTTVVRTVSESVVAVGIKTPIYSNVSDILGTGVVVGDGQYVVTNAHVIDRTLDTDIVQFFTVIHGRKQRMHELKAEVIGVDNLHDLALLKISTPLTPISMAEDKLLLPGEEVAMTGFPVGSVLGLFHTTHKGIISAITIDVLPGKSLSELNYDSLGRLENAFEIYQLDVTAFPGNSGSAVYKADTGDLIGIINKVLVSNGKESVLSSPSGISYAIPVSFVRLLLEKHVEE